MSDFEYIRQNYGVPAKIGLAVVVYGNSGVIAEDRCNYIGVSFDADKPGVIRNCHPVEGVEYGAEIKKIRKMTRGQLRYRQYLDVCECFESFEHWLKYSQSIRLQ